MSNYNVDTLENKIIIEAQEAIKSLQEIIGYVNQSKTAIDSMKNATGLKALDNQAKKTTSNLTKMQLVSKSLKNVLNFTGLAYGAKRLFNVLTGSLEKSIDYIETLNLFEVSMGKNVDEYGNLDKASSEYYTKALKFQNQLNEAFGTNIEETMRYQALYNQMAQSMGINDDASYMISENLTKLGIDLASLFNKSEEDTMEALRAGVLAGQTKPLRNYGLDVTQQTLAPLASELGITRSVKQLSQAEKMILRYIAVLRQASSSHGDFAKTIESPSNQLKVFKQQLTELKTAVGNLFQGMLGQVLPYVNAVLMVIKELIKAVANLFGFKVTSSSTNLADQTGIEDLESGLGGAVGSAKELKAQLMGFDEINNITTDTGSSSGGGSVSSTGIDSKLLDAMSEYDNLMSKVKMKATDIRDKIMDWLGFTKLINPLTGETSWKLREGWTNLKKIWTIIKGLMGLGIIVSVVTLIGKISSLWAILKGTQTATSAFGTGLQTLKGILFKTTEGLGKHAQSYTTLNMNAVKATAGIAGLAVSLYGAHDAMYDYSMGTKTAGEATGQLALSIGGATASGALLGSCFGPMGTAIGAVTGAVIGGISALIGYCSEADKLRAELEESNKVLSDHVTAWEEQKKIVQDSINAQLGEVAYTETLVEELKGLVDVNGKVTKGYEARAEFILGKLNEAYGTEYELIDGTIKGYEEMKESIYSLIEAKKAEIILNENEALYTQAIQNRTQAYKDYEQATENLSKTQEELSDKCEAWGFTLEDMEEKNAKYYLGLANMGLIIKNDFEDLVEVYEEQKTQLEATTQVWTETNRTIIDWENLKTATLTGNAEEIEEALQSLTNTYETETGQQTLTLSDEMKMQKNIYDEGVNYFNEKGIEITEDLEKNLRAGYDKVVNNLIETTRTVEELTPEQTEAWKYLAESNKEAYDEALGNLPEDSRKLVEEAMNKVTTETDNALPKVTLAAESIKNAITQNLEGTTNIKFNVKADYSSLITGLQNIKNDLSKTSGVVGDMLLPLQSALGSSITKLRGYATGGFPEMGEIFMARESGPELVGKIGSRTTVANNSQIVEAVSNGVYTAVSEAMSVSNNNGSMRISGKLNGKELIQFTIDGINGMKQQTGECPIEVL